MATQLEVSEADALGAKCPFCQSPPGTRCVYTAPHGKDAAGNYTAGQPTARAHWQRKAVVRGRRQVARWREARRDTRPVVPASREAREAAAALRQFDRAEYEKLRDWLRDWGWLLAEADLPRRPDGTLRGDSYALGPRGN